MQQFNTPPAKVTLRLFATRIGKICSNVSIVFLILSIAGILPFIALATILIIGFAIIVFSLGTVFITVPDFGSKLLSYIDISSQISAFFLQYWYIFVLITIALSVASLVLLATDKNESHVGRITVASIVLFITLVVMIVFIVKVAL